jgi:nitrate reductase beta subunit
MCISGCPYKKVYYNWATGKSEKCILCYPRQETGQAPACFHACVGRVRYLGMVLYDADRIEESAAKLDRDLVYAQRAMILDPHDPGIIRRAQEDGVHDKIIEAAQKSPVYKYVKEWGLALPLHPEFRTVPMLFYVPPLLPVMGSMRNDRYRVREDFFSSLENARVPISYMATLLSAGDEGVVEEVYKKLLAVRIYKRGQTVGDIPAGEVKRVLDEGRTTSEEVEAIYRLTSMPTFEDRFVIPPFLREMAIETVIDPETHKSEIGVGYVHPPKRGW